MILLVEEVKFVIELVWANAAFLSLSALANIILAALIVFRLVYLRRCARNSLGAEHGSPYTNIITMCVESSVLMVTASGLFTIMCFVSPKGEVFMNEIIPQIYVGGLELNGV